LILCGELLVLQAPVFDGLSLDPFALLDDGFGSSEVGIGRRHVFQTLLVVLVFVMFDKGVDLAFEIAGQEVVFQQDAVFEGLVPARDLTLGLGMERAFWPHLGTLLFVEQGGLAVLISVHSKMVHPIKMLLFRQQSKVPYFERWECYSCSKPMHR
jgi:hypothetical protein